MKVCESDIINTILSLYKLDIKSLVLIKYYNGKEPFNKFKLELQFKPNNSDNHISRYAPNCIDNIHSLTEGGFFVISIREPDKAILYPDPIKDYRLYYSDFIEKLRDNKLNEIGI